MGNGPSSSAGEAQFRALLKDISQSPTTRANSLHALYEHLKLQPNHPTALSSAVFPASGALTPAETSALQDAFEDVFAFVYEHGAWEIKWKALHLLVELLAGADDKALEVMAGPSLAQLLVTVLRTQTKCPWSAAEDAMLENATGALRSLCFSRRFSPLFSAEGGPRLLNDVAGLFPEYIKYEVAADAVLVLSVLSAFERLDLEAATTHVHLTERMLTDAHTPSRHAAAHALCIYAEHSDPSALQQNLDVMVANGLFTTVDTLLRQRGLLPDELRVPLAQEADPHRELECLLNALAVCLGFPRYCEQFPSECLPSVIRVLDQSRTTMRLVGLPGGTEMAEVDDAIKYYACHVLYQLSKYDQHRGRMVQFGALGVLMRALFTLVHATTEVSLSVLGCGTRATARFSPKQESALAPETVCLCFLDSLDRRRKSDQACRWP